MKRIAVACTGVLLLAAGCSLGPREDWAEAIRDADALTLDERTAKVRMSTAVRVIETVLRETETPGALLARGEGVVDFRGRRAKVASSAERTIIFDDLVAFLPRSAASRVTGRQRWARYDFEVEREEDIDDNDRRLAVGAGLISPALAVELLEGVLTGSIERVGDAEVAGVAVTHYRARLSKDAAAREIDDDDRREGVLRLFETLGVQEDIFPAAVYLDAQGLARKVSFVLRQQKDRVNAFELQLAWEFDDYGTAIGSIGVPARSDAVSPPRFRRFVEEFIREAV